MPITMHRFSIDRGGQFIKLRAFITTVSKKGSMPSVLISIVNIIESSMSFKCCKKTINCVFLNDDKSAIHKMFPDCHSRRALQIITLFSM